jgi:luciferase family oxidoreductase group 1
MKHQKTAYSFLELAIVSLGQTLQQALHNALASAKQAEACGYKRIWFAEHHNSDHIGSTAPVILIGYIADNTNSIRVGSGGVMLPNHSPLIVAEQFGTLAQLYPGRIDLGLGRAPGTDQQTAHAIRRDFIQASQLFPAELDKIQAYFSPENRQSTVRVPIAEGTGVPLYILGSSTDSAHLAAAKGLPYAFASHFAPAHLHTALRIYKQEFQPSAFLAKPYTMAGVNVLVADTDAQGEQLFTSLIKMFLGVVTGERKPLQPPTAMTPDVEELFQHPALNQMLRCTFYGTKLTVKKQLQQFLQETGVDELISVAPMYSLDDRLKSIRLFAEIMEEINEGN